MTDPISELEDWIEELCELIIERGLESAPDFITVDSGDGGTGAAPMSLIDNVGLPIKESLPLVVDLLKKHGLKERVKVIASGKLINPADAAVALSHQLEAAGFYAPAIRPPSVPKGTSRVRVSVHANLTDEQLDRLIEAIPTH